MRYEATRKDEANLKDLLWRHGGLEHLEVRLHRPSLVMYSQDGEERINRARLTPQSKTRWRLDMPLHTGKWQATPYEGTLLELFTLLTTTLMPWMQPLFGGGEGL